AQVSADLRRILRRALLVSVPGYFVAGAVAIVAGYLVATAMGQPGSILRRGCSASMGNDVARGLANTACDVALIVFLAHRYLARVQVGISSLPAKLIL